MKTDDRWENLKDAIKARIHTAGLEKRKRMEAQDNYGALECASEIIAYMWVLHDMFEAEQVAEQGEAEDE